MARKSVDTGEGMAASLELHGTLALFGFPPERAVVHVIPRNPAWRGVRALGFIGGGILLAPLVGVIPPHAPWIAGALGFGFFFGIRKWRERYTLETLEACCPKCGQPMALRRGTPLRPTHSVPCDGCHHDSQLTVRLPGGTPSLDTQPESSPPGPPEAETRDDGGVGE
jgi:hypothetical protein